MRGLDFSQRYPRGRDILRAVLVFVLILFAFVIWPIVGALYAHEHDGFKFDPMCCSGNSVTGDCQPIPATSVKHLGNGLIQVTLGPGDHPMVTRVHVYQFEQHKVRWTDNGRNYACLYPNEDNLHCLYLAPQGS